MRLLDDLRSPERRRALAGLAPAALVVGLLAATAGAFAVTEHLKLEPTPITGPRLDKVFSPVCECPSLSGRLSFRLRRADTLTVTVRDSRGHRVRELVGSGRFGKGLVGLTWDGRDDSGTLVPEGSYRIRIELRDAGRTIVLPYPIRVDVTPPRLRLVSYGPRVFSPDGDRRSDNVKFRYRVSELARVFLLVAGERRLEGQLKKSGKLQWYGKRQGHGLPAGRYRVELVARDQAGNASRPIGPLVVRVRYIEVGPHRLRVKARTRFGVRVATDARAYHWRLGRRSGIRRGSPLVLRAPRRPGRYVLTVSANGHRAGMIVRVVRRRAR